jgi:hypothetical protein
MDFPPNSKQAQEGPRERPKRVEQVTSGEVSRRRKPLGRQFKATFFGGDAKTAADYAIVHVIVPAIRDMIFETGQSLIEKIIYGDSRAGGRRRGGPISGQPGGYVAYNRMRPDDRPPMPGGLGISRRSKARHDFDDIVLASRTDAEEVLDRLFDILSRFEEASVADLYELTGIESSHTDHKWGWRSLKGAHVARVRNGGFLLELPDPEPLD